MSEYRDSNRVGYKYVCLPDGRIVVVPENLYTSTEEIIAFEEWDEKATVLTEQNHTEELFARATNKLQKIYDLINRQKPHQNK